MITIIEQEKFEEIIRKIDSINEKVELGKEIQNDLLDNEEFCKLMSISKRTAQNWRDEGKMPFSQIGAKIYYLREDILDLLRSRKIKNA